MKPSEIIQRARNLIGNLNDTTYYRRLFKIAAPIALQNFITSSLGMVGVMMIGQLGDAPVAAVGLANQIFFLLNLLLFGVTSGSAIFTAQLWGKRDIPNIRRVLGVSLVLGLIGSFAFLVVAELTPEAAIGIFSEDPQVIAIGAVYLRSIGWSFVFFAVTACFSAALRSTGDVRRPMVVGVAALVLNTLLSYGLIFGVFGLPAMGVHGAALAVLITRILECLGLLWSTYRSASPVGGRLNELFNFNLAFIVTVLKPVIPVTFNEILWSLGVTIYNIVYARIGTDAIAAINIAFSIDNVALVAFLAIASACAIMVGNRIGEEDEAGAYKDAGRSLGVAFIGALLMGVIIWLVSGWILTFYKVSPPVIRDAQLVLRVISLFLWARVTNMILFLGIFRSGGDTRFGFILDAGSIWVIGVPMALLGAFVFHLPVYWVYCMVMADEITKNVIGLKRYFSKRWIHNLARGV